MKPKSKLALGNIDLHLLMGDMFSDQYLLHVIVKLDLRFNLKSSLTLGQIGPVSIYKQKSPQDI